MGTKTLIHSNLIAKVGLGLGVCWLVTDSYHNIGLLFLSFFFHSDCGLLIQGDGMSRVLISEESGCDLITWLFGK